MINVMENPTNFQNLIGITSEFYYENGSRRDCILSKENIIATKYGNLIPKYGQEEVRRKYRPSLSFYQSGAIRSISLETQTDISTPLGIIPGDLVTFYESGALKRIFPLNGKISGYWTEEDEEKLCQHFQFNFSFGSFRVKIINLNFYESGKLKAMTLWPGETIIIKSEHGLLPVRTGFSLYEDGKIKSIEPAYEITLNTPIGNINAFDENILGITGDSNSLIFDQKGGILSLITSSSKIVIFNKDGTFDAMEPLIKPNPLEEDQFVVVPIKISFMNHYVKFEGYTTGLYDINTTRFTIINDNTSNLSNNVSCGDCSSCRLCK